MKTGQKKVKQGKAAPQKRYKSVTEMVRALAVDQDFADDVERRIAGREILDTLMAVRTRLGMSQNDLAAKMKCTQSRISKLENGKDEDLRIRDFNQYAEALGLDILIVLLRNGHTIVDDIKYHAMSIRRLFGRLTELAEADPKIAQGVAGFCGEAHYNLLRIVLEAADKVAKLHPSNLSSRCVDSGPGIHVELQEDDPLEQARAALTQ